MKKTIILIISLVLLAPLAFTYDYGYDSEPDSIQPKSYDDAKVLRVKYTQGEAYVKRSYDDGFEEAAINLPIFEKDTAGTTDGRLEVWWEKVSYNIERFRWVLYPAVAMLLVVLGITIGRYLYLPTIPERETGLISGTSLLEHKISPAVADHFENLRPLLIDYANYIAEENENGEEDLVTVDEITLKKLVLQNYLLKKIAARENDLSLKQLLMELELILLELSNIEFNNERKETLRRIRDILKESDILFKMKVYNKHKNKLKTLRTKTI